MLQPEPPAMLTSSITTRGRSLFLSIPSSG